jgi:hypothetical protein
MAQAAILVTIGVLLWEEVHFGLGAYRGPRVVALIVTVRDQRAGRLGPTWHSTRLSRETNIHVSKSCDRSRSITHLKLPTMSSQPALQTENSLADLQRGERHKNIDEVFFNALL